MTCHATLLRHVDQARPRAVLHRRDLAGVRERDYLGGNEQICGTCGCIVAYEHVTRHAEWHVAEWESPTVKPDETVGP